MNHGGKRKGAGRPSGSGKYQDTTAVMRIPVSMKKQIMSFIKTKGYRLPLFGSKVSAGFPSPADDYVEAQLNLNSYLIKNSILLSEKDVVIKIK